MILISIKSKYSNPITYNQTLQQCPLNNPAPEEFIRSLQKKHGFLI